MIKNVPGTLNLNVKQTVMMSSQRILKLVHFSSTSWFVASTGLLLILALRQAGAGWWLIFSLSGYSAVLIFLLISLYLFAIFRGVVQPSKHEHPLTTSIYYMTFYDISPFLGAFAGLLSTAGGADTAQQLATISIGTLATTFFVWIVLDPAIGSVEMMLPASREHHRRRQAHIQAMREKQRIDNERLLVKLKEKESLQQQQLLQILPPMARKLAELLGEYATKGGDIEPEVVQIGARAWRLGGIICMRQLHELATEAHKEQLQGRRFIDHIAFWWDGIGSWQAPLLVETLRKTA
ncbi:MAG TPA: hypothetical protein HPP87_08490 [Planctomycetes bacterium]|nr:hypothetical protein [Planctomycetota bacterium]HIJ71387.1 hypothetical protein [Planctomycetota bacterium]